MPVSSTWRLAEFDAAGPLRGAEVLGRSPAGRASDLAWFGLRSVSERDDDRSRLAGLRAPSRGAAGRGVDGRGPDARAPAPAPRGLSERSPVLAARGLSQLAPATRGLSERAPAPAARGLSERSPVLAARGLSQLASAARGLSERAPAPAARGLSERSPVLAARGLSQLAPAARGLSERAPLPAMRGLSDLAPAPAARGLSEPARAPYEPLFPGVAPRSCDEAPEAETERGAAAVRSPLAAGASLGPERRLEFGFLRTPGRTGARAGEAGRGCLAVNLSRISKFSQADTSPIRRARAAVQFLVGVVDGCQISARRRAKIRLRRVRRAY